MKYPMPKEGQIYACARKRSEYDKRKGWGDWCLQELELRDGEWQCKYHGIDICEKQTA